MAEELAGRFNQEEREAGVSGRVCSVIERCDASQNGDVDVMQRDETGDLLSHCRR